MTLGRTVQSAGTWSMNESWLGVVGNQKTLCKYIFSERRAQDESDLGKEESQDLDWLTGTAGIISST